MVDIVKGDDEEVEKGTFVGHWTIDFTLLVEHDVGLFGLDLLLFNFDGSVLGVI